MYIVTCAQLLSELYDRGVCFLSYKILVTALVVGISFLRSTRHVALTALVGNLCFLGALAVTLAYALAFPTRGAYELGRVVASEPQAWFVFGADTLSVSLSAILFLLAQPSLLFPMESAMARPRDWPKASNIGFGVGSLLNALFGLLCYISFGKYVSCARAIADDGFACTLLLLQLTNNCQNQDCYFSAFQHVSIAVVAKGGTHRIGCRYCRNI